MFEKHVLESLQIRSLKESNIMSNDEWEVFTGRSKPVVKHPVVSVQTRGNISFNRLAYETLGQPAALELLFNVKSNAFALRPADPNQHTSYPVRKQPNSISYLISAQAFCKMYGIGIDRTRRYAAELINGMLVVSLVKPISEPVDRRRANRKQSGNEQSS